jgi:RNA polymerase sigma-70 factor, ECF subfamily
MPNDYATSPLPETTTPVLPETAAAQRDADIVCMLQSGQTYQAFETLVQRYETKVFHLCLVMLHDTHLAQDMAQDSLLRALRSLAGYKPNVGALSTWIYAITRNRCLTELGRRKQSTALHEEITDWEDIEQLPALAPHCDGAALDLLRSMIDALPTAYQTCLKLYYFEEHSVDEVADMLALPQGTVKTHLHRARQALYHAMQARGLADATLWL